MARKQSSGDGRHGPSAVLDAPVKTVPPIEQVQMRQLEDGRMPPEHDRARVVVFEDNWGSITAAEMDEYIGPPSELDTGSETIRKARVLRAQRAAGRVVPPPVAPPPPSRRDEFERLRAMVARKAAVAAEQHRAMAVVADLRGLQREGALGGRPQLDELRAQEAACARAAAELLEIAKAETALDRLAPEAFQQKRAAINAAITAVRAAGSDRRYTGGTENLGAISDLLARAAAELNPTNASFTDLEVLGGRSWLSLLGLRPI